MTGGASAKVRRRRLVALSERGLQASTTRLPLADGPEMGADSPPGGGAAEAAAPRSGASSSGQVALDWRSRGRGPVLNSWVDVERFAGRRLLRVLLEWRGDLALVCVLFRSNRQIPARMRLFVDAMADWLDKRADGCRVGVVR